MSIDYDGMKRRMQMQSASQLQHMMNRIELMLTWRDLDSLVTDSVTVTTTPNGVWLARSEPPGPMVTKPVRQSAVNALTICSGHSRAAPYSRGNVMAAKKLVRDALYAYALPAEA